MCLMLFLCLRYFFGMFVFDFEKSKIQSCIRLTCYRVRIERDVNLKLGFCMNISSSRIYEPVRIPYRGILFMDFDNVKRTLFCRGFLTDRFCLRLDYENTGKG